MPQSRVVVRHRVPAQRRQDVAFLRGGFFRGRVEPSAVLHQVQDARGRRRI